VASGQAPTLLQGLGITIALGGATLAAVEPGTDGHGRRLAAGISLAALAAVAFGAFFVSMDMAADGGALWAVALNRSASFGLIVVVVLTLHRPCPLDRRSCAPLVLVGALDILANALFAVALTVGMAAVVSVLGSLYSVATVLLARLVAHEQLPIRRYAGVSAALAGVALVTAG
jgi:drug/metabolite transporter (DMT)-like permease